MSVKQFFRSRRFQYGAVSTGISVVFIALIVVVNVVASVLSDKFPLTIDLTPNSAFNLSQESLEYVKGVEKPVSITVLARESDLQNTGNIYLSQIKSVIDQYAKYNKNISLTYVDIVKDPTFATKYEELSLTYYDVLIESGERRRKLSLYDMFNVTTNQQTFQQYITSSKADEMMTSAIMGVTSDEVVKVGILTGLQEDDTSALRELLEKNNFEVADVPVTAGEEIDPAIDVLFWNAPKRDPDAETLKKLDSFLSNGQQYGKNLFYAASTEQGTLTNLDEFLAEWGVAVDPGAVLETNRQNIMSLTSPYYCAVDYESSDYMEDLSDSIRVVMPYGRPLRTLFEAQSGYSTSVLLTYSETASIYPMDAPEDWQPTELQKVPAMIRAQRLRYDNTTELKSCLFVLSSSAAFEQAPLTNKSVSNADYLLSVLNTITEREDVISIAPKDLSGGTLDITALQATLIAAAMVIVVPLAIIIAGFVVWMRRRHK